jgi:hypothetical protein
MMKIGWRTKSNTLEGSGMQSDISNLSVEFGDDIELEAKLLTNSPPNSSEKHPTIYIRVGKVGIHISGGQVKIVGSAFVTTSGQLTFHDKIPEK